MRDWEIHENMWLTARCPFNFIKFNEITKNQRKDKLFVGTQFLHSLLFVCFCGHLLEEC